jgi:hypothetical protein
MTIFGMVFEDEPALLEEKRKEIRQTEKIKSYWYNILERCSVKRNLAHSFCQFALNWRSMSKPPLFGTI